MFFRLSNSYPRKRRHKMREMLEKKKKLRTFKYLGSVLKDGGNCDENPNAHQNRELCIPKTK